MDTLPPVGDLSDLVVDAGHGATFVPCAGAVLSARYTLVAPIGRGASGWVWKAKHMIIGRYFAIKLLATCMGTVDQVAAARMLREAKALSRVDHPGVTRVTDFGHAPDGTPFIVMELLEGQPLRTVLRSGRLSWTQIRPWAVQMLEGLEAAHDAGVVHGDLKPANLFVTAKVRRIKVIDFGLARPRRVDRGGTSTRHALGNLMGTPTTMSPEQIGGASVSARSDLYSIGCILYEMIAGRPVVRGTPAQVLYQHVYADPPPLRSIAAHDVPDAVCDVVHRCLSKEPELRPRSVADVREVFVRVSAPSFPSSVPARSYRWRLGAAVLAGLGLFALVAAARPQPAPSLEHIQVRVPTVALGSVAIPNLRADPPVFERAEPKQQVLPVSVRPKRRALRSTSPPTAKRRAVLTADTTVPDLKNPFPR